MFQLAWSCYDEKDRPAESAAYLIRPEGFSIPPEVQRIHRISTERANAEGKPLLSVLEMFAAAVAKSETVVAHNLRFDENVISAEYLRQNLSPPFGGKKRVCTMTGSVNFCRIPGPYGYKWPSLSELHRTLFGRTFEEAHDAGADVAACADCFLELRRRHLIA